MPRAASSTEAAFSLKTRHSIRQLAPVNSLDEGSETAGSTVAGAFSELSAGAAGSESALILAPQTEQQSLDVLKCPFGQFIFQCAARGKRVLNVMLAWSTRLAPHLPLSDQ